jgi:hypothetical protein
MEDNGLTIVEALKNREAIAVSDGSFKTEYGTAAWVIEGVDSHGRILGQVIAPGGPSDQSPYRSELTGIYSIMIMVNRLCEFYDIKEGEIELACDGLSALDKCFSHVSVLHVDDPNYDLIGAIKHQWIFSPVFWKVRHVAGHQDDHRAVESLDR